MDLDLFDFFFFKMDLDFFGIVLFFKTTSKSLDPSYKMDLDFSGCSFKRDLDFLDRFGRENLIS